MSEANLRIAERFARRSIGVPAGAPATAGTAAIRAVALSLLAACGGGGGDDAMVDPHAPGTCDQVWVNNGFDQCEAGCVDSNIALNAMGPSCTGKIITGMSVDCQKTFVFHGTTGCCASAPPILYFAACP